MTKKTVHVSMPSGPSSKFIQNCAACIFTSIFPHINNGDNRVPAHSHIDHVTPKAFLKLFMDLHPTCL